MGLVEDLETIVSKVATINAGDDYDAVYDGPEETGGGYLFTVTINNDLNVPIMRQFNTATEMITYLNGFL